MISHLFSNLNFNESNGMNLLKNYGSKMKIFIIIPVNNTRSKEQKLLVFDDSPENMYTRINEYS